jgi:hypothetical protein
VCVESDSTKQKRYVCVCVCTCARARAPLLLFSLPFPLPLFPLLTQYSPIKLTYTPTRVYTRTPACSISSGRIHLVLPPSPSRPLLHHFPTPAPSLPLCPSLAFPPPPSPCPSAPVSPSLSLPLPPSVPSCHPPSPPFSTSTREFTSPAWPLSRGDQKSMLGQDRAEHLGCEVAIRTSKKGPNMGRVYLLHFERRSQVWCVCACVFVCVCVCVCACVCVCMCVYGPRLLASIREARRGMVRVCV